MQPSFMEEMIKIHLNPFVYVPMVCSNQYYMVDDCQATGGVMSINGNASKTFKTSPDSIYEVQILQME